MALRVVLAPVEPVALGEVLAAVELVALGELVILGELLAGQLDRGGRGQPWPRS